MASRPCLFVPGATSHAYLRLARGELVFDDRLEVGGFVSSEVWKIEHDGRWCRVANHHHLTTSW